MKRLSIVLICVVLFLVGCTKGSLQGNPTPTPSWQDKFSGNSVAGELQPTKKPSVTKTLLPEAEKMNQTYRPKEGQVELVLLYDARFTLIDDAMLYELNTQIAEKGYGFYVSLIGERRDDYSDGWCRDYVNSGNQVDLVCTGANSASYRKNGTNTLEMIREGLLLSFSEYPDIPEKKLLWETYPESVWEKWSVLGDVYGVRYFNAPFAPLVVTLNTELAEKLELEVPDKLTIEALDTYLKKAAENGYYPMVGEIYAPVYAGYTKVLPGLYVKETEEGIRAMNLSEDDALKQMLLAFSRYRKNGWLKTITYQPDGSSDMSELHNKNTLFFFDLSTSGQLTAYWDGIYRPFGLREESDNHIEVKVRCYKQKNHSVIENNTYAMMGITSSSEHKEEALQFLKLLQTDEQLVKLLRYGVENVHYVRTENGYEKNNLSAGGIDNFGNNFMYFEGFEQLKTMFWPMNSEDRLEQLFAEDYTVIPFLEPTEEQSKILEKAGQIMESYQMLFSGKRDDVEKKLNELSKKLEDIGYNRVLEKINERYFEKH